MASIDLGLKCVQQHIGQNNLANNLEANLKEYFDYALLTIGGWVDVDIPTSGFWGNDLSRLRPVDDPNYTEGTVWESPRKDWVWQTGINYIDTTGGTGNPQAVGTVYVNGVANTGFYANYPEGQIVFDSPVGGTVQLSYSYRVVQIYKDADSKWWRELQYESYRSDSAQYLQASSGFWSVLSRNRIQLPAVIIKSVAVGQSRGYQLGSEVLDTSRQVQFTVLAESAVERNNIMDIFNLQSDRNLKMFDVNTVDYPFDYRGVPTGTKMYTNFIQDTPYIFRKMRLSDSRIVEIDDIHPNLYMAVIRTNVETLV
jgi:hypothetical protein